MGWRDLMSGALADPELMGDWERSLKRLPTTILGGPVDLANAAIGGLDYLGGGKGNIHASEKPVGGSQWLAEQVNKGIPSYPTKPGSANADMLFSLLMGPVGAAAGRGVGNTVDAIAAAKPTPVAGSPAAQAGVLTYHGTPHKFDRYNLEHVGTGEGAQVYGHGMYFAENPTVATAYQRALSKELGSMKAEHPTGRALEGSEALRQEYFKPGRVVPSYGGMDEVIEYHPGSYGKDYKPWSVSVRAKEKTPGLYKEPIRRHATEPDAKNVQKVLGEEGWKFSQGNLYQQDLPDEILPRMLNWDAPMSQQPEHVRKAVAENLELQKKLDFAQSFLGREPTGGVMHTYLGGDRNPEKAAETLRQAGIPGVSYLDQGSRGAGFGTRNHVVWDQELLDRMVPLLMK